MKLQNPEPIQRIELVQTSENSAEFVALPKFELIQTGENSATFAIATELKEHWKAALTFEGVTAGFGDALTPGYFTSCLDDGKVLGDIAKVIYSIL